MPQTEAQKKARKKYEQSEQGKQRKKDWNKRYSLKMSLLRQKDKETKQD
jgi:hypothetical protein